ncbi:hypothetical protein LXL04_020931 [Taraxacum kok-saghyz]
MSNDRGYIPSPKESYVLQGRHDLLPEHGVQLPQPNSMFSFPPDVKFRIYLPFFDAGFRILMTDFQDEVLHQSKLSLSNLTPNSVNKIVGFEKICRALDFFPTFSCFQSFLQAYLHQWFAYLLSTPTNARVASRSEGAEEKLAVQDNAPNLYGDNMAIESPVPVSGDSLTGSVGSRVHKRFRYAESKNKRALQMSKGLRAGRHG